MNEALKNGKVGEIVSWTNERKEKETATILNKDYSFVFNLEIIKIKKQNGEVVIVYIG